MTLNPLLKNILRVSAAILLSIAAAVCICLLICALQVLSHYLSAGRAVNWYWVAGTLITLVLMTATCLVFLFKLAQ